MRNYLGLPKTATFVDGHITCRFTSHNPVQLLCSLSLELVSHSEYPVISTAFYFAVKLADCVKSLV